MRAALHYPRAYTKYIVELRPSQGAEREVEAGFVVDLDLQGHVVGIEILDLKRQAGERVIERLEADLGRAPAMSFSYDRAHDAFYLTLWKSPKSDSRPTDGVIVLDGDGHVLRIETELL